MLEFPVGEKLYHLPFFQKAGLEQEIGFHHGISRETIEVSDMDDVQRFPEMGDEIPFWEGVFEGASALPQNLPSFPCRHGHSDLWLLGRLSCHARNRFPFPPVFSSFLIPLEVSVLPVSSAFPFRSFHHFYQMLHMVNHSSNLGSIRQGEGLIQSLEPKASDGLLLILGSSDHTFFPLDCNRLLHIEFLSSPLPSHAFFQ